MGLINLADNRTERLGNGDGVDGVGHIMRLGLEVRISLRFGWLGLGIKMDLG